MTCGPDRLATRTLQLSPSGWNDAGYNRAPRARDRTAEESEGVRAADCPCAFTHASCNTWVGDQGRPRLATWGFASFMIEVGDEGFVSVGIEVPGFGLMLHATDLTMGCLRADDAPERGGGGKSEIPPGADRGARSGRQGGVHLPRQATDPPQLMPLINSKGWFLREKHEIYTVGNYQDVSSAH